MDSGLYSDVQSDIVDRRSAPTTSARFSIGLSQQHPPGEHWAYSSAPVEVLGEVLERATGRTVEQFARSNVFEPLDMTSTMSSDPAGSTMTFMGMQADCLDLARLGYLASDATEVGHRADRREASGIEAATPPSQTS